MAIDLNPLVDNTSARRITEIRNGIGVCPCDRPQLVEQVSKNSDVTCFHCENSCGRCRAELVIEVATLLSAVTQHPQDNGTNKKIRFINEWIETAA
jgi:hypothetical protein